MTTAHDQRWIRGVDARDDDETIDVGCEQRDAGLERQERELGSVGAQQRR